MHRNGSFAPAPHPAPQAAHMDVELGQVDGVCPDTPEAAAPDDGGSKRWFTRGRRLPWGTRYARKPPPWAGDAAGDDASAHAAVGAEDLRTSSGDSAAFPSAGQKLLKLVMLFLLLASLALGTSLAYKTGACDTADMRCAALRMRANSSKPSRVPDLRLRAWPRRQRVRAALLSHAVRGVGRAAARRFPAAAAHQSQERHHGGQIHRRPA